MATTLTENPRSLRFVSISYLDPTPMIRNGTEADLERLLDLAQAKREHYARYQPRFTSLTRLDNAARKLLQRALIGVGDDAERDVAM